MPRLWCLLLLLPFIGNMIAAMTIARQSLATSQGTSSARSSLSRSSQTRNARQHQRNAPARQLQSNFMGDMLAASELVRPLFSLMPSTRSRPRDVRTKAAQNDQSAGVSVAEQTQVAPSTRPSAFLPVNPKQSRFIKCLVQLVPKAADFLIWYFMPLSVFSKDIDADEVFDVVIIPRVMAWYSNETAHIPVDQMLRVRETIFSHSVHDLDLALDDLSYNITADDVVSSLANGGGYQVVAQLMRKVEWPVVEEDYLYREREVIHIINEFTYSIRNINEDYGIGSSSYHTAIERLRDNTISKVRKLRIPYEVQNTLLDALFYYDEYMHEYSPGQVEFDEEEKQRIDAACAKNTYDMMDLFSTPVYTLSMDHKQDKTLLKEVEDTLKSMMNVLNSPLRGVGRLFSPQYVDESMFDRDITEKVPFQLVLKLPVPYDAIAKFIKHYRFPILVTGNPTTLERRTLRTLIEFKVHLTYLNMNRPWWSTSLFDDKTATFWIMKLQQDAQETYGPAIFHAAGDNYQQRKHDFKAGLLPPLSRREFVEMEALIEDLIEMYRVDMEQF